MNGSILWKLTLTVLAVIWATLYIVPTSDTPFDEYVVSQVEANQNEFQELTDKVETAWKNGEYPTYYVALAKTIEKDSIDFAKFFPQFDVSDIKNLKRRNETLISELLRRSKGKVNLGLDLKGGVSFTFKVKESDLSKNDYERTSQLEQARGIIADRVDGLGVAEPVITLKGSNRIEVQMPGISTKDNPEAIDSISAPALLEFCMVSRTPASPGAKAPIGYTLKYEERENKKTGEIYNVPYFVKNIPEMTGENLTRAVAAPNQYGGNYISLKFNDKGAEDFARVTRRIAEDNERNGGNPGQLAIVLDGKLHSAPTVREEIRGGGASITGNFTQREAMELANVLNNPLQVGLEVEEMYEVGPSLASDARDSSLMAGLIGAFLVVLFMVGYYTVGGVVAMFGVLINILLVFGALSYIKATLTLPGVAAMVLTIGMAVDANILIFERIREELKEGKTLHTALINGFDKVFSTIVDANVTTLITAVILILLGSGPVKGFGLTLAIGIVATVFCSLVITRWVLELLVNVKVIKKLLTREFMSRQDMQFLNYSRKAFTASWSIVLIGVLSVAFHSGSIFGIDFVGGDELTVDFNTTLKIEEVQKVADTGKADLEKLLSETASNNDTLQASYKAAIDDGGFGEVSVRYQNMIGQNKSIMKIQTETGKGEAFYDALEKAYKEHDLVLTGETRVGSSVGSDVTSSALESIIMALIGIMIYIALRFEIGYGIGAVTATVHDILMTIGVFVTLGQFFGIGSGQFTAPMIASILMTVGYSINDTIVVFDRIREELDLHPDATLRKIVHIAINRTLSRTLLTSITTLLATLALYLFGAGVIVDFALVFLIGILTGTFSSIFIASPIFFWYHKGDRKKVEEHHILPAYDWTSDAGTEKALNKTES